jgi:hypothetical protein
MGNEIWKDVVGHESSYRVSSKGRVWSKLSDRELVPYKEKNGYIRVSIRGSKTSVHRLVVLAFVGEIPKGMVVDHINNIRNDNDLSNLRIVDYSLNVRRGNISKRMGISLMKVNKTTPRMWRADIWIYNKKYFIGSFRDKNEAEKCYRETHLEFFGDYF